MASIVFRDPDMKDRMIKRIVDTLDQVRETAAEDENFEIAAEFRDEKTRVILMDEDDLFELAVQGEMLLVSDGIKYKAMGVGTLDHFTKLYGVADAWDCLCIVRIYGVVLPFNLDEVEYDAAERVYLLQHDVKVF